MADRGDVTQLLVQFREGDREALDRLVPIVYEDLRRIARSHLRRGRSGHSMDTVGLVNEAWLRLVDQTRANFEDRQHFLSVCARAMRQILISSARKHQAAKRGGGEAEVTYDDEFVGTRRQAERLLAVDQALEKLSRHDERLARVVECRYFAGLSEQETAEAMGISKTTVSDEWSFARDWLHSQIREA